MILLTSVFRDSTAYLGRYFDQVERFRKTVDDLVYLIAVEGDSNDDTLRQLRRSHLTNEVLHCEHGGRLFDSVVHPLRWRQLSTACNVALCAANRVVAPDDRFIYIESDLIWEPETLVALLARLSSTVHAVAPMSMQGGRFYDIWAYVKDGRPFRSHRPYYDGWNPWTHDLTMIDTAGSCFVCDDRALKVIEFSAIDCIKGIGRSLAANGMQLWLDPTQRVEHPR